MLVLAAMLVVLVVCSEDSEVLLVLVHRRLGHFHGYHVGRTFVRVLVASLVAAVPASLILLGIVATTDASVWTALASTLA